MAKEWKYHPEQSECCGSDTEIFTDNYLEEGYGYDGDEVRCRECLGRGQYVVIDYDEAYMSWDFEVERVEE